MRLIEVLQSLHFYSNDAILITDVARSEQGSHRIVFANSSFEKHSGYSSKEIIGQTPRIFQGPKTDQTVVRQINTQLKRREPVRETLLNYRKDGSEYWVEMNIVPVADGDGEFQYFVSVQRDVTAQKNTEILLKQQKIELQEQREELKRTNLALQSKGRWLLAAQRLSGMGSWYLDLETDEVTWTEGIYKMFGLDPSQSPPNLPELEKFYSAESWAALNRALINTIKTREPYDLNLEILTSDGKRGWVRVHGEVDATEGAKTTAIQGIVQDITQQKKDELKIRQLALSDPLTGIPNRKAFNDYLEQSLNLSKRYGGKSALVLFDLDDFKEVNDNYGHAAGDAILQHVASMISNYARITDIAARLGGDEFALFFYNIAESFDGDAKVSQIITDIAEPIRVDGQYLKVQASAGVAFSPDNARTAEELMKCADLALYAAKDTKDDFRTFHKGMTFAGRFSS